MPISSRLLRFQQTLWLRLLAALLYLAGQGRAVLLGHWSVCCMLYTTSAMDFHRFYCSRMLVELQAVWLGSLIRTHQ
jgi:hypothetical protein